jgi:hypothetical protein
MLRNHHYAGKVVFNKHKETVVIENGEKTVKRLKQSEEDILVAEGKHPAIIDAETWEAAQKLVARHPRVKYTYDLKNPFSGILVCSKCGKVMHLHQYKSTQAADRYQCRNEVRCFKSLKAEEMNNAIFAALELAELPALELKVKNGDGNAAKIQQTLLTKLEKQMAEYRDQEDKQFELLETGVYSQEVFERRNAALRAKMDDCQKQIYLTKSKMPKSVDYAERVAALKDAIEMLKDPEASPAEKNKLLRAIVERIEYTSIPTRQPNGKLHPKGYNPFSLKVFLRL